MGVYELFAVALDYPSARISSLPNKLAASLDEQDRAGLPPDSIASAKDLVERFRCACESAGPQRLEEIYTATFDMTPDCSLYVGYHLFGDDWRRSSYLVQLQQLYRAGNFQVGNDLPDHLPTILRFIGLPGALDEAEEIIGECLIPAVSKILSRIKSASNPYQWIFEALLIYLDAVRIREESMATAGDREH